MLARFSAILLLVSVVATTAFAQVEEKDVDFTISPAVLTDGKIHVAYEWLTPSAFAKKNLSVVDTVGVYSSHPGKNHIVASKLSFVAKRGFDQLSYVSMNQASFISKMLNSVSVKQRTADTWAVTNKVRAYGFPFNVSFNLKFTEVPANKMPSSILNYLRDEGAALRGSTRERFLILDMTNFSQLMYRNYSYVYIKEVSPTETIIVSAIVAGFDISSANSLFNFPPFSSTRGTMMNNMKEQIMQMARSIQSGSR